MLLFNNQLRIVPNPASSVCRIDFEQPLAGNARVQVFDPQGKMLVSEDIAAGETGHLLDLSAWPRGLYFVMIADGNGEIGYGKVVKE